VLLQVGVRFGENFRVLSENVLTQPIAAGEVGPAALTFVGTVAWKVNDVFSQFSSNNMSLPLGVNLAPSGELGP
jgi:hypothetical protein